MEEESSANERILYNDIFGNENEESERELVAVTSCDLLDFS